MENWVTWQRQFFQTGQTLSFDLRKQFLLELKMRLKQNEARFLAALEQDLGKSSHEAYMTEIGIIYEEIDFTVKHLRKWMKPEHVPTPMTHIGAKSLIYREPYGVVLVIAPWNYPYQLTLSPLIGAIAAGNTAIVKPSEWAPATERVLKEVLQAFPTEYLVVACGGPEVTQNLIEQGPDYLFFTGSTQVGKIIMKQASEQLIPLTLELGGKSPVIIAKDCDLKLSARRVAFGKWTNAGQTCIAPDYALIDRAVYAPFMRELERAVAEFYGEKPLESPHYGKIISLKHFKRLKSYSNALDVDESRLKIAPLIMEEPDLDSPVMQEEIFGPILPVIPYTTLDAALTFVCERPKPLALYLFTNDRRTEREVLKRTSSGGVCVNDTLMHIATPYLPFGGVGASGMGRYHGKASFDTFSHQKSILKQTTLFDLPFRYPGSNSGEKWLRRFLK
ncbi:aldehyde dehydrogenase [Listeria costaricensis]|uniref:aldehyde dehydrogenase n=1 Tax=Listeria costaricensis TaxID=2026604 RepID=UPI000C06E22E|nr:aldehyde dehydrogenase [Listeria costaricensis]